MKQLLMAVDQALNCLVKIAGDDNAGWGMADELLSARAWRCHLQGLISDKLYRAIDALFFGNRPIATRRGWASSSVRRCRAITGSRRLVARRRLRLRAD